MKRVADLQRPAWVSNAGSCGWFGALAERVLGNQFLGALREVDAVIHERLGVADGGVAQWTASSSSVRAARENPRWPANSGTG